MADQEVQLTLINTIILVLLIIFILFILVTGPLIIIFINNYTFLTVINWILIITAIIFLIGNSALNALRFIKEYPFIDAINWIVFGIIILLVIYYILLVTIKGIELNKNIFIILGIILLLVSLLFTILPHFTKKNCQQIVASGLCSTNILPKALRSSNKDIKELYLYNDSTKSLDPVNISIGDEKIVDVTQSGSTTYYILSNGNIYLLSKNEKGDTAKGIISQSIKINKLRDNLSNNHYALSNNTLYYSDDLVKWTPLFYNIEDFDIPYDGKYMYVKFDNNKSIIYDTIEKKIDQTLNTGENRVYGRNINEYNIIQDNKIIKSDGVTIPNALKAVYDLNGELHILYPNQKLMDKNITNIFGTQTSILYGV